MRKARIFLYILVLTLFPLVSMDCATAPKPAPEPAPKKKTASDYAAEIGAALRDMNESQEAQAQQGGGKSGAGKSGESSLEEIINQHAQVLAKAVSKSMGIDFEKRVYEMFGAPAPVKDETIMLEAVDEKGDVSEVPVVVQTRELRSLTQRSVAEKALRLVSEDELATEFYKQVPEPVQADAKNSFRRVYEEVDAKAIAMEARLIVALKGGDWAGPEGNKPAANAIAVRGLDFDRGLSTNSNKTYDDTMYLVVESPSAPPEVFEYRMTTESSSQDKGVGRLKSKQVTYVRGKHRGTDPAYRLLGNAAPGTRVGVKGEQQITGANIHSAYAKRPINSETPLKPNVSLGCQVIAASKSDFEKGLVQMLDQREVKQFPYTIVEDAELAEFDKILQSQGEKSVLADSVLR